VLADFREVVVVNGVVRLEFHCLELVQRCGRRDRIGGAPFYWHLIQPRNPKGNGSRLLR
jgi:hypothetical protein